MAAIKRVLVRFSKDLQLFERHRRCPCSFEQGIALVSLPSKVSWCDLARNCNGLNAIAGVHVRLTNGLHWFGCHQKYPCMQAVIAKTKYKFYLVGVAYGLAVGGDNGAERRPSQGMSTGITLEMYDLKL